MLGQTNGPPSSVTRLQQQQQDALKGEHVNRVYLERSVPYLLPSLASTITGLETPE